MINQHNDSKRVLIKLVEFSYQWFKDSCESEGYDPDNVLSAVPIGLARECAMKMKKYMDAKKNHLDERVQNKLDKEINTLNNERIGHMLDALQFAELVTSNGQGFESFLKSQTSRKSSGGVDTTNLTPLKKRINERWNKAMELQKG